MSVVVLYKEGDTYKMTGDGRITSGTKITTDGSRKVYVSEDSAAIFGIIGNMADTFPIKVMLNKYYTDPWKLLLELNKEDVAKLFVDMIAIVASGDGFLYAVDKTSHSEESGTDNKHLLSLEEIQDEELPYFIGSGATSVRAILSLSNTIDTKSVTNAIRKAYKVEASIGGAITTVEIEP